MSKDKNDSMDAAIREEKVGTPATNNRRAAYALAQLVREVKELYPEIYFEYSHHDGRNTALAVTFDCTDEPLLAEALALVTSDARVLEVLNEDEQVYVSVVPSARTQDDRSSFNFYDAWAILAENEEGSL